MNDVEYEEYIIWMMMMEEEEWKQKREYKYDDRDIDRSVLHNNSC